MARLGFAPVVAASASGGPVGIAIGVAATAVTALASWLVPARGNFAKYDREIAPQLLSYAQQSGQPAYAYWFGDVVGTAPDGSRVLLGSAPSQAAAAEMLQAEADRVGKAIWALWDGVMKIFAPSGPVSPLPVDPYSGSTVPVVQTAGMVPSGNLGLWLLLGAGAYYLLRGKK